MPYFTCPYCSRGYTVPDVRPGDSIRCRRCDEWVRITRDDLESSIDDEDCRPRRRQRSGNAGNDVLGILSIVFGIIGLVMGVSPCLWYFSLPVAGIGLVLGLIGAGVQENKAAPIVGSCISGLALLVPLLFIGGAVRGRPWGGWW